MIHLICYPLVLVFGILLGYAGRSIIGKLQSKAEDAASKIGQ